MIKHYIFDIGNVIVDFNPMTFFDKIFPGKQMKEVCRLVFQKEWEEIDAGIYLCDEVRSMQMARWPAYREQIQLIYDHYKDMMICKEDTITYIKELKAQGNRIYFLSNIGEEAHQYLQETYDFFDLADGMMLSYKLGYIKPDNRIYEQLLATYSLTPEECIFFDDKDKNVEAAKALGIRGVVFQSVAQAKQEVNKYVIA